MSIKHLFQYAPLHAHINLLGWASLALAGIMYQLFPKAGESILGKTHFWFHNIGLPIMMVGLFGLEFGNNSLEPVIAIGASLTSTGIILFAINVYKNVKQTNSRQIVSSKDVSL